MVAPLAIAGVGLQVAGMFSSKKSGRRQRRAIKRMMAARNKALADQRQIQMAQLHRSAKRQQGALRTAVSKSGITMSGSAVFAAMESQELAAIDAATLSAGYQSQMDVNRMSAASQISASRTNSGARLLSGLSNLFAGIDKLGINFSQDTPTSFGVLRSDQR